MRSTEPCIYTDNGECDETEAAPSSFKRRVISMATHSGIPETIDATAFVEVEIKFGSTDIPVHNITSGRVNEFSQ